ncbi:unnamed protein product [Clonostachys chloroleuca]|uniref:Uncharacterized protein n=1 Tax=Clonostachys chloroleuca TaxID=1926264 RepID=A0AA35M1A1_9HYPO|nr:unnamed protein product [Clonostachys chloroleuca]
MTGKKVGNMTYPTLSVYTMIFGGRSPSVKISELGLYVKIRLRVLYSPQVIAGKSPSSHN